MKLKLHFSLPLFFLYSCFFLLPYYKFDSNNFQPVDIIILSIIFFFMIKACKNPITFPKDLMYWASLYIFGIILGLIDYLIFDNLTAHISAIIIFSYNCLILISFFYLFTQLTQRSSIKALLEQLNNALLLSTLIPIFLHHHNGDFGVVRLILSFNNPNQLGYFALLNISILYYVRLLANDYKIKLNNKKFLLALIINIIFVLLSLSRSSLGGVFLLLFFLAFNTLKFRSQKNKIIFGLVLFSLITTSFYYISEHIINFVFASRGDASRLDLGARFYDGLSDNFNNLWVFFFGYGQVGSPVRTLEFHNTFIETFSELGIFAFLFLIFLALKLFYDLFKIRFMYIIPMISFWFFNFFNYGLRFRYANIFLAFVFFVIYYCKKQQKH